MALLLAIMACGGPEDGRAGDDGDASDDAASGDLPGSRDQTPDGIAPSDTGAWVVERPDGPMPVPDGWTTGASAGGSTPGAQDPLPVNTGIRTARQDGYDRVVFDLDSRVPGYRIEYVDSPQYECGSGEAVRVPGDGWLQVAFEPANAHTEEGQPTVQRRLVDPAGANLRELRRICDFEAHVTWVIGVGAPNPYRAFVLDGPPRLVVDVRQ